MLLYKIPAGMCFVMAMAHELMGGPVVAETLAKGTLYASSLMATPRGHRARWTSS